MTTQIKCAQGFTLIELMIAIGLSSVMMFGVLQIFDANKQSNRTQMAFAEVQDSGRIGIEFLVRDIRMADFWGCAPDTDSITDHLANGQDGKSLDPDWDPSMSVKGASGVAGEDNVSSKVIDSINVKDGSDVLTLKGAYGLSDVKVEAPYMNVNAATIHINTGVTGLPKGKILMITDCTGGDLFSNTHTNTEGSGNIIHNTGNQVTGAVDNDFKDLSRTYTASAQIIVPFQKVFFIGQNSVGGWSLYRKEDTATASELVRNVDDLQFTYGEDTNADASADSFGIASGVTMDNVVSIRTEMTISSSSTLASGNALQRSYSATANIRNRTL